MDVISAVMSTASSAISTPEGLMALVFCAVTLATAWTNPGKGVLDLASQALANSTNPTLSGIGQYLHRHQNQTISAAVHTAAAAAFAPRPIVFPAVVGCTLAAFLLPAQNLTTIALTTALFTLFLRARRPDVRVLLAVVTVGLFIYGWL